MASSPDEKGDEALTPEEQTSRAGDLGRGSHEQTQGVDGPKPEPGGKTPPPPD